MFKGKSLQSKLATLFVFLVSVVLVFLLAETVSRLWLQYVASENQFAWYASQRQLTERRGENPYESKRYTAHRYMGYYPTPNYTEGKNRHNVLGYRGNEIVLPKPEDEFRIVCIGGSTTYTMMCEDYRQAYPALLEKELRRRGHSNVTVINAGAEGWSSYESFVNLGFRVVDLDPDCIIVYHAINDIFARLVWPPEAYTGDNRGWKRPAFHNVFMPPWYEHSTFVRILLVRAGISMPHDALRRTVNPRASTSYEFEFARQIRENVYPQGIFRETPAAGMFEANKPVYFQRNLANIARLAEANGIDTIFATFAYTPDFPGEPSVATEEYQQAFAEMNEVIHNVANDTGAYLFDFANKFPADKQYYVDGYHVNETGSRLKAQLFADYIESCGLYGD